MPKLGSMNGSSEYQYSRHVQRLRVLHNQRREEDLCDEWRKSNPNAIDNFMKWFMGELAKKPHLSRPKKWNLIRLHTAVPYGPGNCVLVDTITMHKLRPPLPVTDTFKKAVREFAKDNPDKNYTEIAKHFPDYNYSAVRNALLPLRTIPQRFLAK